MNMNNCPCGSGLPKEPLYDARGIFAGYVCEECEERKRSKFRPEIFSNPCYSCDEVIEPDDY